uniref:Prenyl transferase n=1 Tax=Arundo donax TaxID=35708 RepID=A0A0A9GGG9_ARUDO
MISAKRSCSVVSSDKPANSAVALDTRKTNAGLNLFPPAPKICSAAETNTGFSAPTSDFRLLLSFSKSSETTSISEETETRSGTLAVVAVGIVCAGTSIAARPGWVGEATKQTHGVRRRLGAARVAVQPAQRHRQEASCTKSNAFLLMDTPGQLRDNILRKETKQSKNTRTKKAS